MRGVLFWFPVHGSVSFKKMARGISNAEKEGPQMPVDASLGILGWGSTAKSPALAGLRGLGPGYCLWLGVRRLCGVWLTASAMVRLSGLDHIDSNLATKRATA